MASLVLGAAGAFVGSFFGAPQVGWAIGSAIGASLDAPTIRNQGPRMSDLKVQVSTYGNMIPIIYGSMRVAGNVIWSSQIRETASTTSQGGKGGPSVETTTYTYAVDIAVALCEGQISGIRKIWAYGKLIYNIGPDATTETLMASQEFARSFAVYPGSETQIPDATIEVDKGAGNAPAYRGTAYVVFNNFQLGDYGNRVPNFEFEIVQSGTFSTNRRLFLGSAVYPNLSGTGVADGRGPFNLSIADGTFTFYAGGSKYRTDLNGALLSIEPSHNLAYGSYSYIGRLGDIELKYVGTGGAAGIGTGYLQVGTIPFIYKTGGSANEFVGACVSAGGSRLYVFRYTAPSYYLDIYDQQLNLLSSAVETVFTPAIGTGYSPSVPGDAAPFAVESNNTHLWVAALIAGNLGLYQINADGTLTALYQFPTSDSPGVVSFGALAADRGVCMMASYHGTVAAWTRLTTIATSSDTTVGTIATDQAVRSGMSASDVDVTALTDAVHGFAITRQGTGRKNIEQLQKAFYFDGVEADNVLRFAKRGGAALAVIPFDDLAAHESGQTPPDPLSIRRAQEVELPSVVTINYINQDGDYQAGSESSRRLITSSKQQVTEELAVAMTANNAAQIADVLMYDAHVARAMHTFQTTKKYAKYLPADVVTVSNQTASYRLRLTKKDESGPLIKWDAVADDATVYNSGAAGATQQTSQVQVTAPGPTRAEYLDIPIIRDQDDDAGFYVALAGYKPSWRGATLFRAPDDAVYAGLDSAYNNATLGMCDTTLGSWTGGNMFDEANSVTVTLSSGTLSGHAALEVLNGANACLIGREIVQFRDAVLVAANRYKLSGLLRGRRGTEQHIGTHASGELFVLFAIAGVIRPNEGSAAIGAQRYYKPVSFGQKVAQVPSEVFTNNAVGLKPLSPANLGGGKQANGDFIITWQRRTRIDGSWRDNVDVPLGEASESYSIDIMSGSTVKRTLTSTTPSVTYTAAQQTADFGGAQTSITVNVYQVSATVGRGFPASKTY